MSARYGVNTAADRAGGRCTAFVYALRAAPA
jgi:hypothetical protein